MPSGPVRKPLHMPTTTSRSIFWVTIFVQLALGLNAFISGQGAAKAAMLSVLIGAVINIRFGSDFHFCSAFGRKRSSVCNGHLAVCQRSLGRLVFEVEKKRAVLETCQAGQVFDP